MSSSITKAEVNALISAASAKLNERITRLVSRCDALETRVADLEASAVEEVLFQDAGKVADFDLGGMGEVEPRQGSGFIEYALSGSQNRSEVIIPDLAFVEGERIAHEFDLYIVGGYTYGRPGAHNIFCQFKSDGDGSPELALELWDYAGDDGRSGGKGLWVAQDGNRFLAPISEGAWHRVRLEVGASHADGSYAVFLDGQKLDERTGVPTIAPDADHAYLKNGVYRNGGADPGPCVLRQRDYVTSRIIR